MRRKTTPKIETGIRLGWRRQAFGLLDPHLSPIDFTAGKELEACRRPIRHVCFPESGIISVVADGAGWQDIEVGMIGREGMTGLAIVMGTDLSPQRSFVQVEGRGWQLRSQDLIAAIQKSSTLHRRLLQYAHAFLIL